MPLLPARVPILAATLLLLASLLPVLRPHAQSSIPLSALPRTTQEHLRSAAWWPTKLMPTQTGFVGSAACAGCHAEFAAEQAASQMARTLAPAAHSAVLAGHLHDQFHSGPYTTAVTASRTGFVLHTTDGSATLDAVPQWAFGSGEVGQSYLWQSPDGAFHESRFNFFHAPNTFVDTPGRLHGTPTSLAMAASRPIEPFEAQSCFRCHVTTMPASLPTDTAKIVPGIGCEACHGPGAAHVAAARAQAALAAKTPWDRHILNPENLSPTDAVDLCGSCHSTPADVRLMGAAGPQTVRFPAYRLENSRCWLASSPAGAGDDRLTCQSCHNPHAPLDHVAGHYDSACLACHTAAPAHTAAAAPAHIETAAAPKTCPVATHDCTSCHMPRVSLPEMHTAFTDHQIRTPHSGQPFPDTPALGVSLSLSPAADTSQAN